MPVSKSRTNVQRMRRTKPPVRSKNSEAERRCQCKHTTKLTIGAKSEPMARKWGLTNVLLPPLPQLRRPGLRSSGLEDLGWGTHRYSGDSDSRNSATLPEASAFAHLLSCLYHS